VVESLVFRSAIDIGQRLALFEQRLAAAGALLVFLTGLFFIEWPLARALWAAGSQLEMRMRQAFLRKLPLLGTATFRAGPSLTWQSALIFCIGCAFCQGRVASWCARSVNWLPPPPA